MACTATSSTGLTRDCPTGGVGTFTMPCPPSSQPNPSCPPHNCPCTPGGAQCCDGWHVGPKAIDLSPLTTGTASDTDPGGLLCPGQTGGTGRLLRQHSMPHDHRERRGGGAHHHRHPGERDARLGVLRRGLEQFIRWTGQRARPWRRSTARHLPGAQLGESCLVPERRRAGRRTRQMAGRRQGRIPPFVAPTRSDAAK